jgi:hypothetical protein
MSTDASLFPELPQTPQARTYVVRHLVFDELARGRVRVPEFQRPLRWKYKDNVALFDSLWRGYPIGSLLLWKRPAEAATIQIGASQLLVPAVPEAKWVVDGQQRVTALAAAMMELPSQDVQYRVYFDPHRGEFFVPHTASERRPGDIPVSVLADAKKLNRWIRDNDITEKMADILDTAHVRIAEYAIPVYEIDTPDEAPLRAIFARLNSTGARMQAHEVFHALLGRPTVARESIRLDVIVDAVRGVDFGELERAEALKCLLSASEISPTHRPENLEMDQIKKLIPAEAAAEAARLAAYFLRDVAGLHHLRLVPYPVVFILLCRFFHLHPTLEAADQRRLASWVWRGIATGVHQRAEVSRMREALRDMKEGEGATLTIDRLLRRIRRGSELAWALGRFDLRSAATRVEVLSLFHLGPRRLPLLGDEVDGGAANMQELLQADPFVPVIYQPSTLSRQKEIYEASRTAANRVLFSGHHSMVKTLGRLDPLRHHPLLSSHLISDDMLFAIQQSDPGKFLRLRGDALRQHVTAFLHEKAGWDQPEMAPIQAYMELS